MKVLNSSSDWHNHSQSAETENRLGGTAGELDGPQLPGAYIAELVYRLRPDIIKKLCESGVKLPECSLEDSLVSFLINEYKEQTVDGTNYFVRLVF